MLTISKSNFSMSYVIWTIIFVTSYKTIKDTPRNVGIGAKTKIIKRDSCLKIVVKM